MLVVAEAALASIGPFREEATSLWVEDPVSDDFSVLVEAAAALPSIVPFREEATALSVENSASDDFSVLVATMLAFFDLFEWKQYHYGLKIPSPMTSLYWWQQQ